jgi:tryptophan 2,3-dioxygenase
MSSFLAVQSILLPKFMENDKVLSPTLVSRLRELQHKYSLTGQDLMSNLEGLLHANYLKYWDYIHLDTLLSLQNPKTDFPDEMIFIGYHQITELYFKLILHEIEQIAENQTLTASFLEARMNRINRYVKNLTYSFDIMVEGMEYAQFNKFRMALLPASGFQSAQFRFIEICATDFVHLLKPEYQNDLTEKGGISEIFPYIYWKAGATDTETQAETITSIHFQERYKQDFIALGEAYKTKNIWQSYLKLPAHEQTPALQQALREFDLLMNVDWRLSHFRSAVQYLKKGDTATAATGGTNWQKYLPPRFQRTIFYPELWTEEEKQEWGKHWVMQNVF